MRAIWTGSLWDFMVCVVGLLITPGPYHRIVEGGEDSGNFHRLVTVIADLALLPFALALGLDLFITAGRVFGDVAGAAAGTAATAVAVAFWYGFPRLRKRYSGEEERAVTSSQTEERSSTPLHPKIEQMLIEARARFARRSGAVWLSARHSAGAIFRAAPERVKDYACGKLFHGGLSVVLLIAPAAYHRIVYAGEDSQDMHRVGSALLAATVPLALGLVGDVYVVITKIVGTPTAGLIAGSLALVVLIGLWRVYPLVEAYLRNRTAR